MLCLHFTGHFPGGHGLANDTTLDFIGDKDYGKYRKISQSMDLNTPNWHGVFRLCL